MMDDGEIRPLAIRAPWASQCVTSAQWVLETEIFGQIAEQFCGPPHSQMKSFQHFISTRPQFKDKILQTDTRHYDIMITTGLIWVVSFVLCLCWPFFLSDCLLSAPIGWARRSKLKQHQVLVPCSPLGSSVNIGNFCFVFLQYFAAVQWLQWLEQIVPLSWQPEDSGRRHTWRTGCGGPCLSLST